MPNLTVKPLTTMQRTTFLSLMGDEPNRSTREALRLAGYTAAAASLAVTKADVRALFAADPDLYADMRRAQKRNLEPIEGRVYAIALDERNARSLDAAKFLLERRHPDYIQQAKVEHEHTGEVNTPDVAAALERFTALADAAIRAAARGGTRPAPLEP